MPLGPDGKRAARPLDACAMAPFAAAARRLDGGPAGRLDRLLGFV